MQHSNIFRTFTKTTGLFLGAVLLVITAQSPAAPAGSLQEAKEQALRHLDTMLFRLKVFHHEARSSMISSLDLNLFKEYFALPESKYNVYDEMGVIQLSEPQDAIRRRMEDWILGLHKRFAIGETCLIDKNGQEHLRVVGGRVESPLHFSDEETGSPFFAPTFRTPKGEVHLSEPYMSADTYYWVVAFTSPIVLENGEVPAFYHFEVPLAIYAQILRTKDFSFIASIPSELDTSEEGRYFIINRDNMIIADSKGEIDFELVAERHPEKNPDLPDFLPPERLKDYLPPVSALSGDPAFLDTISKVWQEDKGVLEFHFKGQGYVMAFGPVPDRDWRLIHLDPVKYSGFWEQPAK